MVPVIERPPVMLSVKAIPLIAVELLGFVILKTRVVLPLTGILEEAKYGATMGNGVPATCVGGNLT